MSSQFALEWYILKVFIFILFHFGTHLFHGYCVAFQNTNAKWTQPLGPEWLQTNTSGNPGKSAMGPNENSPFQLHSGSAEHQINPPWQLYSRKKLIEGVRLHSVKFIVTLTHTPGYKWPSHRHAWLTVMLIKITRIIKSMLLWKPLYKR